jgi:hypothetical protein
MLPRFTDFEYFLCRDKATGTSFVTGIEVGRVSHPWRSSTQLIWRSCDLDCIMYARRKYIRNSGFWYLKKRLSMNFDHSSLSKVSVKNVLSKGQAKAWGANPQSAKCWASWRSSYAMTTSIVWQVKVQLGKLQTKLTSTEQWGLESVQKRRGRRLG